jgi:hypothetical protein
VAAPERSRHSPVSYCCVGRGAIALTNRRCRIAPCRLRLCSSPVIVHVATAAQLAPDPVESRRTWVPASAACVRSSRQKLSSLDPPCIIRREYLNCGAVDSRNALDSRSPEAEMIEAVAVTLRVTICKVTPRIEPRDKSRLAAGWMPVRFGPLRRFERRDARARLPYSQQPAWPTPSSDGFGKPPARL